MTVAVIGGGQLARMMQESAIALGINLRTLVEAEDGSTGQVTVDKSVGEPGSWEDVAALIEGVQSEWLLDRSVDMAAVVRSFAEDLRAT